MISNLKVKRIVVTINVSTIQTVGDASSPGTFRPVCLHQHAEGMLRNQERIDMFTIALAVRALDEVAETAVPGELEEVTLYPYMPRFDIGGVVVKCPAISG
jgi:hypothetical protein